MKKTLRFRQFFEITEKAFRKLLLMEFHYEEEIDWYEVRVYLGHEVIAYVHGYANRGWSPQVNNIWVAERFRRKRIASTMIAKVEGYFGQVPLPATPIEDNAAARGFWKTCLRESWIPEAGKEALDE